MPLAPLALTLLAALAPLDDARAQLEQDRPDAALATLEATLEAGGLEAAEVHAAYALMGRALGALERAQQAERAFAVALRVSPSWRLDDAGDPRVAAPYGAALAALPDPSEGLFAEASAAAREGREGVRVRLVADDLDLVAGALALRGGAAVTTLPLSRAEPELFFDLPPGGVVVQLVDVFGNELARVPVRTVIERGPPAAVVDEGELRWLALGGGTLLGLGAVGVGAAGLWFAAVDGGDLQAPEGTRTVAVVGVGVATGIIALGGALVVLDFLLQPDE